MEYKNISFTVWDVGGQGKIRPLWKHCEWQVSTYHHVKNSNIITIGTDYPNTRGLIFVIDSNDTERVTEAREELHALVQADELRDALLLVFANKQDLPQAMSPAELTHQLDLQSLKQRTWYIQARIFLQCGGLVNW